MTKNEHGAGRRNDGSLAVFTSRLVVIFIVGVISYAVWRLSDILVLFFGSALLAVGLSGAPGLSQ